MTRPEILAKLAVAETELDDFRARRNLSRDPYQIALRIQNLKRQLRDFALDRRRQMHIVGGGNVTPTSLPTKNLPVEGVVMPDGKVLR